MYHFLGQFRKKAISAVKEVVDNLAFINTTMQMYQPVTSWNELKQNQSNNINSSPAHIQHLMPSMVKNSSTRSSNSQQESDKGSSSIPIG